MLLPGELVVDNFAGGGGASTGMELGLNRHVDIAINHDQVARCGNAVCPPVAQALVGANIGFIETTKSIAA